MKRWILRSCQSQNFNEISRRIKCHKVVSELLVNRPLLLRDILDARIEHNKKKYFENTILPDIEKASSRINVAIEKKEKICIYGDYDADGVSSTAMLFLYLKKRGANISYYIPDRYTEGYGLNTDAIDKIYESGVKLIVTVDNGISAFNEIEYAKTLSIDVVVTDHHQVPEIMPNAVAIVDPHRTDFPCKFKEMAGVGVAFCLIYHMEKAQTDIESLLKEYSIFTLFGTIGDSVPLINKNRVFVSAGLDILNENPNIGVQALISQCFGSKINKEINSYNVAFSVVPKINAAGRIAHASIAVELLISECEETAEKIAKELIEINKKRKEIEEEIVNSIRNIDDIKEYTPLNNIIILIGKNWSPGVIGIVASRLLEKYNKPVLIITKNGETARGSARSVPGFSIYNILVKFSKYFESFGGHPMAAGFDILTKNIEKFKNDIINYAKNIEIPPVPLYLDAEIAAADINFELANSLTILEPFGESNEKPLFKLSKVKISSIREIGNNEHLKLSFTDSEGKSFSALKFFTKTKNFNYETGDIVDLAINIEKNLYCGRKEATVIIIDIRLSDLNENLIIKDRSLYEKIVSNSKNFFNENSVLKKNLPVRKDFEVVYKYLKKLLHSQNIVSGDISVLFNKINKHHINFCKLLLILHIFSELSILKFFLAGDYFTIEFHKLNKKTELKNSKTFCKLYKDGHF